MKYLSTIIFLSTILTTISAQSDQKALDIADQVVEAMGGMDNYNNTRYITWNFFGRRPWIWDKWTGNVRCEVPGDDVRIAMNVNSKEGAVFAHGVVQTSRDSLDKYLEMGYRMWINDSYWLVMPFKLKDPGTTLKYAGMMQDASDTKCHVLELTFNDVGVTPDNKYWIYVDPASNLIVQWDYFSHYDDEEARLSTPWTDYEQYGSVKLSSGRGQRGMGPITTPQEINPELFKNVEVEASALN